MIDDIELQHTERKMIKKNGPIRSMPSSTSIFTTSTADSETFPAVTQAPVIVSENSDSERISS